MKKYTADMAKLIALVFITPLLVMGYTKIEHTVSLTPAVQTQGAVTGATPVSIGLMNKVKTTETDNININDNSDYMLVKSIRIIDEKGNKATAVQTSAETNRFSAVLL